MIKIITVGIKYGNEFNNGEKFGIECYKHMKPLQSEQPIETDFKTKVIELIEKRIAMCIESMERCATEKNYDSAWEFQSESYVYEDFLKQIKEL